jgi:Reverse transcriptase (RNA-dependent DNA polymerase)
MQRNGQKHAIMRWMPYGNDTWELVKLSPSRKAVKSKWVFKLKIDEYHHARVVAKGFTQIPNINYDETFSPVACFESLRLLLALAALENWEIHQAQRGDLYGVTTRLHRCRTGEKGLPTQKAIYGLKTSLPHMESIPWYTYYTRLRSG